MKEHRPCPGSRSKPTVIGIDIGKNTFHLIGLDGAGEIVMRCKLSRRKLAERLVNLAPCLIGMEACVGAHHLSRRLSAMGHDARLMPAQYVKPYLRGQKNDYRDAEAIAEAVERAENALCRHQIRRAARPASDASGRLTNEFRCERSVGIAADLMGVAYTVGKPEAARDAVKYLNQQKQLPILARKIASLCLDEEMSGRWDILPLPQDFIRWFRRELTPQGAMSESW